MTELRTASIGSYPRIGEEKDDQRHRRGLGHFERGEISAHAFRDVVQSVAQEIVRELGELGLDEITDGLISWADPISHLCANLSGIRLRGPSRYFDANFYYRVPIIAAKPRFKQSVLAPEYEFAAASASVPCRAVVTGPHTLAAHSIGETKPYQTAAARADLFTEIVAAELKALAEKKPRRIQIDEPSLLVGPQDWKAVERRFTALRAAAPGVALVLATYYADASPVFDRLAALPVDGLHLDFVAGGDALWQKLEAAPVIPEIGFGLLNARSTAPDLLEPVKERVARWIAEKKPASVTLSASSGLEGLPRPGAREKVRTLVRLKAELAGLVA